MTCSSNFSALNSHKLQIQQLIATKLTHKERLDIVNYIAALAKVDIIAKLPVSITTLIFQYFTPSELCALRLVSRTWNKKVTHDSIWRNVCIDYSIVPQPSLTTTVWDSTIPIYFDLFQKSLSLSKNWKTMKCKRIELKYHKGPVLSMIVMDPTRIFTGDIDGKIHIWNSFKEEYMFIQAHKSHVSCLSTDYYKYLASGSSDMSIVIHDLRTFKKLKVLIGHEDAVTTLSFNQNHILFSGSVDRTIRIWDVTTGECLRILHGQENTISTLVYCPNFPKTYCQSEMEAISIQVNQAGYLISGSSDQNIFLWDLKCLDQEPEVINTIMNISGPISSLNVYNELVTDNDRNAMTATNEYICSRLPINIPTFIIFSAITDTAISLYSLPGLEKTFVESPNIHKSTIWSISTAVIHSKLVTTSGDRTAIIWDLKSPKNSVTLAGFDSAVVTSSISPQEEILCFGTEKGTIILLDLTTND